MKKLLIGIAILTIFICVIWGIVDQTSKGFRQQAARVAAEAGRR